MSVVTVALPSLELCGGCADTVLAMQRQRKEDGCEGVVLVVQSSSYFVVESTSLVLLRRVISFGSARRNCRMMAQLNAVV